MALVHDFLLDLRGAERVFLELCKIWPNADLYTTVYDEDGTEGRFAGRQVYTSFLQRLRPTARTFRALLPLLVVVLSASASVRADTVTLHLSSDINVAMPLRQEAIFSVYDHTLNKTFSYDAWAGRFAWSLVSSSNPGEFPSTVYTFCVDVKDAAMLNQTYEYTVQSAQYAPLANGYVLGMNTGPNTDLAGGMGTADAGRLSELWGRYYSSVNSNDTAAASSSRCGTSFMTVTAP